MSSEKQSADKDVLVRRRTHNGKSWSEWEEMLVRPTNDASIALRTRSKNQQVFSFTLALGGTFHVYPNLLSEEQQEELSTELVDDNGNLFRQYRIQGTDEPRAHFLLHKMATDDENSPQPGYRYGGTTMMATSLGQCPKTERLAAQTAKLCGVDFWNIGADIVLLRCGRDHMGNHADDDQGETKILTVLVSSPSKPRGVIFQRKPKKLPSGKKSKKREAGDEQWQLNLGAGDAYDMDGVMQKHYHHGVPKGISTSNRLVVVFRHGTYTEYTKDSGRPLADLTPRKVIPRTFGRMEGLIEGNAYHRTQMKAMGAHNCTEKGVSGKIKEGCNAIVVSGARADGLGHDNLKTLIYAAETRVGGGSMLKSMKEGKPIRVFRSYKETNGDYRALTDKTCRYDGNSRIIRVSYWDDDGNKITETRENLSKVVTGRLYLFELERMPVGTDSSSNEKTIEELMEYSITNNTLGANARAAFAEQESERAPPPGPDQMADDVPPPGPDQMDDESEWAPPLGPDPMIDDVPPPGPDQMDDESEWILAPSETRAQKRLRLQLMPEEE